jgi:hypothetical protein
MLGGHPIRWWAVVALTALLAAFAAGAKTAVEPSVEELKARLSSAAAGDRPRLCLQIAQRQLTETDKFYAATEIEKAQATLADVVSYSEQARDHAIQLHKQEKQSEITVRQMARKLTELMHTLPHDDQAPVRDAVNRLQRVRDDLLMAMFPKGIR